MKKNRTKDHIDVAQTLRARVFRIFLAVSIAAVLVAVGFVGGAVAKYFYGRNHSAVIKSKEFYFTSDYMTPEGKEYTLNPGTLSVPIELRNYDGLNSSELDIHYTVSVEPAASVSYSGDQTITVSEGVEIITVSGLEEGKTYTVTVTGSSGYVHTLRATFTVEEAITGVFKNTTNYGDYVLLTVWSEGMSGTVTVTVPQGLIPDATDDALTGKVAGSAVEVSLNSYQSRTFRFFIADGYGGEAIPVILEGALLDESTLN